jgi:hypothetical protein
MKTKQRGGPTTLVRDIAMTVSGDFEVIARLSANSQQGGKSYE